MNGNDPILRRRAVRAPHRLHLGVALVLLVARLAVQAQSLPEQSASGQPYTLKTTSRLVVLDVVVTDKTGHLRNDLTRDDFNVTEDGVAQQLISFERPALHEVGPLAGPPIGSTQDLEQRAPQSPVDILVLDEINTSFTDMAYVRYALEKYLNAQPDQKQAPTMLIAVGHNGFQVLHDYTQDRAAILDALKHHLTAYPWHLQTGVSRITQLAQSLGALEQVAQGTAGHPGHKNLIWIGKGFPGIDLTAGNVDAHSATGINGAVQQAVNMLRDSRVTLYTIDPTALSATVTETTDDNSPFGSLGDVTGADPFAGDVNFTQLAKETGGKSFFSRNDVDREIGESVRDGVNYYTLSYRPSADSDADKPYRRIRIALVPAGLTATYRDGYYSHDQPAPEGSGGRVTYDMDAAEESTMTYTGLHVAAVAKPETPGTYVVGVPAAQLVWSDEGDTQSSKLELVAVALDAKGRILRRAKQDLTVRRSPAESANPSSELARMEIALPQAPATVRIRFVVRNAANGHIGTADLTPPRAAPPSQ